MNGKTLKLVKDISQRSLRLWDICSKNLGSLFCETPCIYNGQYLLKSLL